MNQLVKRKMSQISNKKKGFTLVELIIVIAIIAILAAMAIPRLGAMRQNARVSNDVAAAKNIGTIVATMVANGELATPTAAFDIDSNTEITGQLQGRAAGGTSEATNEDFSVVIANDGTVTVSVNGNELYPDVAGTGRQTYSARAR